MNKNQYKLKPSRNSSGAMVVKLLANENIIFITSRGYQLGCALHALGLNHLSKVGGSVLGYNVGSSSEEQAFWGETMAALTMNSVIPSGGNGPEYHLVSSHLPGHLVTVPYVSFLDYPKEKLYRFVKSIHYPVV